MNIKIVRILIVSFVMINVLQAHEDFYVKDIKSIEIEKVIFSQDKDENDQVFLELKERYLLQHNIPIDRMEEFKKFPHKDLLYNSLKVSILSVVTIEGKKFKCNIDSYSSKGVLKIVEHFLHKHTNLKFKCPHSSCKKELSVATYSAHVNKHVDLFLLPTEVYWFFVGQEGLENSTKKRKKETIKKVSSDVFNNELFRKYSDNQNNTLKSSVSKTCTVCTSLCPDIDLLITHNCNDYQINPCKL